METELRDHLVSLRRDLHAYPEPAWREYRTMSRIVDELDRLGVEYELGADVLAGDERMAVPDDAELDRWLAAAREHGAREDVLEAVAGGYTGCVATVRRGDGPIIGLRVDVDALPLTESSDESHVPATKGFRSTNEGYMHACGHDAHAAIGIGVLETVANGEFDGTFKVFFQPAEEVAGGGKPLAFGGHLDDVDYLYAAHVGLDHPTGEIVTGIEGILAVEHFHVEFTGEPAHAGKNPELGRNAVQAMAAAIQNLYAIARHDDGVTRINAGAVSGGTAVNIIPAHAEMEVEVRGETTALKNYMKDRAVTVIEAAADMYDCTVTHEVRGGAPSGESDRDLMSIVGEAAAAVDLVDSIVERADIGGSEDVTYLLSRVTENGGKAAFIGVGTDHPTGHHTSRFDVDEPTIEIAVDVLSNAIERTFETRP